MFNFVRRSVSILKAVNGDTHLWCLSVLAGAILLCISFFVEPSARQFDPAKEDTTASLKQRVIEYSSVLGSLSSSIETLGDEEVDKIAEAMPVDFDEIYDESEEEGMEPTTEPTKAPVALPSAVPSAVPSESNVEDKDTVDAAPVAALPVIPSVDIMTEYSPETVDILERLVQCEAGTEDMDGRLLVANVVLNRVETGIWGDDITSVVMAAGQFDPIRNGAYKGVTVDSVTKKAVINALLGEDISQGAIYFQKSAAKVWGNKQYLFRHGSHSFYK